ncbi:MAG: DUF5063 domain-containing protein [Myxococcota bacterium]
MASAEDVEQAVEQFFALLEGDPRPPEDALLALADVLDRLMALGRRPDFAFEDGHPEPPATPGDYRRFRDLAASRFPTLGLYNLPLDIAVAVGRSSLGMGDADDDVADIARDLSDVRWAFAHTSAADALWRFHFGFDSHWGAHANDLRWYLYARARDR